MIFLLHGVTGGQHGEEPRFSDAVLQAQYAAPADFLQIQSA
jgi:hypothetical protein